VGTVAIVIAVLVVGFALSVVGGKPTTSSADHGGVPTSMTPLQGRIVSIAQGQVGYATDPPDTYCNKYSAYWASGAADCANGNLDEEWCADFAA